MSKFNKLVQEELSRKDRIDLLKKGALTQTLNKYSLWYDNGHEDICTRRTQGYNLDDRVVQTLIQNRNDLFTANVFSPEKSGTGWTMYTTGGGFGNTRPVFGLGIFEVEPGYDEEVCKKEYDRQIAQDFMQDAALHEELSRQERIDALKKGALTISLKKYRMYYGVDYSDKVLSTKDTDGFELDDKVVEKLLGPFLPFKAKDFEVRTKGRGWKMYGIKLSVYSAYQASSTHNSIGIIEVEPGYDVDKCKLEHDLGIFEDCSQQFFNTFWEPINEAEERGRS